MLATTLWFVVTIGIVAAMVLDTAAIFARSGVTVAADHAIEPAVHEAIADYQQRLAAALAATPPVAGAYGPALAAVPNPLVAVIASAAGSSPALSIGYTVVPTTVAPPACASPQPDSAGDAIGWLQCADAVQESRLSLHVAVDVRDAAGAQTLAHRDAYIALRLFAEPPYSAIVGRKDGAADDPARADARDLPAHEGDIGGDTVSGEPLASVAGWPAGGTLIHVRYACRNGAGQCANGNPPDPDAALRNGVRWKDGNRPEP